jgi:hypothetical protein
VGHGFYGVMHQVEQHPPESILMQRHLAQLGEVLQLEHNPVCGEGRGHFLRKLGDEQMQVRRDQPGRPHAHQGEIILEEVIETREVCLDLGERLGEMGAGGDHVAQLLLQQIDVEKDRPERIADFMRQPGGEAA